jgi:hypothetical protein
MSDCKSISESLVFYAEGVLQAEDARRVERHLAKCAACREEADRIRAVGAWLRDPDLYAPASDHAWQELPETMAARASRAPRSWAPSNPGSLRWALGLAAALVIGFGILYWSHGKYWGPAPETAGRRPQAPGNEAFLSKIYGAHAREATAGYLSACQDLLMDTLRAEANCSDAGYDVSSEVARARSLLRRKRLLDQDLRAPEVAHARGLCDELESFLLSLSTSQKCESPESMRRMEKHILKQQLLLRIRVLQGELS